MSTLADVVLPLPLYKYFTYRIPSDLQEALQIGVESWFLSAGKSIIRLL